MTNKLVRTVGAGVVIDGITYPGDGAEFEADTENETVARLIDSGHLEVLTKREAVKLGLLEEDTKKTEASKLPRNAESFDLGPSQE